MYRKPCSSSLCPADLVTITRNQIIQGSLSRRWQKLLRCWSENLSKTASFRFSENPGFKELCYRKTEQNHRSWLLNTTNNLHRTCIFTEKLCHCPNSRADFQYELIFCNIRRGYDFLHHMRIDQKILSISFLKVKFLLFQYFRCLLRLY